MSGILVNTFSNLSFIIIYTRINKTFQGDSGGPIFYREREIYYIYGVTSFGLVKTCSEDAAVPGIYTKVEKYLDWIEGIVWPNDVLL